ncbi:MAG: glycosyltransferase [Candidatus Omnitrophica bacterium]|nr:glycosyltransferase [Candidatus Omnitrophota bacterium]
MFHKLSIILPTYNEKENVVKMVSSLRAIFVSAEIIVVDDNSLDGTLDLAAKMAEEDSLLRIIKRSSKRSLVASLQEGINMASGEIVVWMDCDFSMPPDIVSQLTDAVGKGFDISVGSRYVKGGGDFRGFGVRTIASVVINRMAKYLLNTNINDLTSGFIAARKNVLEQVPLRGIYGEYCIDFLVRAQRFGYKIKEIPYSCVPRRGGKTKTASNPVVFLYNGFNYLAKIISLMKEFNKNENK